MKKIFILVLSVSLLGSCTKTLDELLVNPNGPTPESANADLYLTQLQLNFTGFFGMADLITYDATCIRLREASLSYSLPSAMLNKTPFGALSVTFSGQNLFYNAPNFPKFVNFDPETSSLGVSNVRGLEYLSGPTSRRYGVSVRVSF